jgi:hypothetical protein
MWSIFKVKSFIFVQLIVNRILTSPTQCYVCSVRFTVQLDTDLSV